MVTGCISRNYLSVIIATLDRCALLQNLFESFTQQTYPPHQFEIIVIDNGSIDLTAKVCEAFQQILPNLRYFYDPSPGLHVGRHKGLKEARSDILVYTDDDIEAFPRWLEGIAEAFEDKDVALVGGKNLPKFEIEPSDWIMNMWEKKGTEEKILDSLSIINLGDKTKQISPHYVFGCNFAIRKSVLLEAGGFHPDAMPEDLIRYRGDGELHVSRYISDSGYKTIYSPMASVYHHIPRSRTTKAYFCRRAYNQGISDSYTQIRSGKSLVLGKNFLRRLKHKLQYGLQNSLQKRIQEAYWEGYSYHQKEVRKDPSLHKWVMKISYM